MKNLIFIICFIIFSMCLFSACNNKENKKQQINNTVNNYHYKSNENKEEYDANNNTNNTGNVEEEPIINSENTEYKNAYNEVLLLFQKDKKNNGFDEFVYYSIPPLYDIIKQYPNLTYDDFKNNAIMYAQTFDSNTIRNAQAIFEESGEGSFKDFQNLIKNMIDSYKSSESIKKILSNGNNFTNIKIINEKSASQKEIADLQTMIDGNLYGNSLGVLSILGLNEKNYRVQNAYKTQIKFDDDEKDVWFYYMNGDWRFYSADLLAGI